MCRVKQVLLCLEDAAPGVGVAQAARDVSAVAGVIH